ncbi:MAG: hypothetical protein LAT82_04350 [Nanoarchaeota archaeon]|nr:hypothetical protein [Nanoarchaeota archaeon]
MSYQIPTCVIEEIRKNSRGDVIIDTNHDINYLFGLDLEDSQFHKSTKIYITWEEYGDFLNLSYLEKLVDKVNLRDIIILLNIFESIGRIKRKKSLRIVIVNEKISKEMLLKVGYNSIEDSKYSELVNLEGSDLYEKYI